MDINDFCCERSGLVIRGKVYKRNNGRLPSLIISHGFMSDQASLAGYAMHFAELGFAVYTFDFCGGGLTGISDGKTEEMTVFTEADDLKAVIVYVKSLDCTDSENLFLMGFSQGGFVSGIVAAEMKNEIKGIVLYFPALCIPDNAREGKMISVCFDPNNIPEYLYFGEMVLGRCFPEAVRKADAFELISGYEGKVLLVHGTDDELVDLSYSKKAAEIYKDAVLEIIDHGTHGFYGECNKKAIDITDRFLVSNTI